MKYLIFFLLAIQSLYSQFNVAYYKTEILEFKKKEDTLSQKRDDKEIANFFTSLLKKSLNKEYKLVFDNVQSNFKELSSLHESNNSFFSGNNIIFDYVYANVSSSEYLEQKEMMGKTFIISDTLYSKWEITNETKDILGFKCLKANLITKEKNKKISAWFTSQIEGAFGPEKYSGLPGLILELNKGELNLICYKLDFENKIKIDIPSKGKKVTQKEFDAEMNKKFAEIQGFYKN